MDGVIDRLEWYQEILKEDHSSPIFAELAKLLYEEGRFEDVVEVCKKGLIIHPYHLKGQVYLGLALISLGRREEGIGILKDVEKQLAHYSIVFVTLSNIYKEEGDTEEANRLATIARLLGPYHPKDILKPVEAEVRKSPLKNRLIRMLELVDEKLNMGVQEVVDLRFFTREERNILISFLHSSSKKALLH
ncbi:MAG: hypothetical protein N2260_10035 [Syntrophobacterales bacterium]|nr:hypothetical protein [Syntrophobacterales bacterium]